MKRTLKYFNFDKGKFLSQLVLEKMMKFLLTLQHELEQFHYHGSIQFQHDHRNRNLKVSQELSLKLFDKEVIGCNLFISNVI